MSPYRRTPQTTSRYRPVLLTGLCFMALLASPFAGFALEGKVTEEGLLTGLKLAILPLAGLAWLAVARWIAWRRLPSEVRQEWREGRVIAAEGAPRVDAPIRFDGRDGFIDMRSEGVLVSHKALLGLQGMPDGMAHRWVADQAGQLFLPWQDCAEWIVEDDSDGPDFYRLRLRAGGHVCVRRLHGLANGDESRLLDAVRSIGGLAVRLLADVDEAPR